MRYVTHRAPHGVLEILRVILWQRGAKAPIVVLRQCCRYLLARLSCGKRTFAFQGRSFPYCFNIHNQAFGNERTVEVPLALNLFPLRGRILEIGNVLGQYTRFDHIVVDKFELDEQVVNVDIVDYAPDGKFDLILSISTFEHIGFDEDPQDAAKVNLAVRKTQDLLNPGGKFLMTIPVGYNQGLDKDLDILGFTSIRFLTRINWANAWHETSKEEALKAKYGHLFPAANAIAVCVFEN